MFYTGLDTKGEKTLFITGIQSPVEILQRALMHGCVKVCLGFKESFNPTIVHPVNEWNFMFEELIKAEIGIDLFLHKKYTQNIELWNWAEYEKFSAIINGYKPKELKEIE
jgi:hypothetical protein